MPQQNNRNISKHFPGSATDSTTKNPVLPLDPMFVFLLNYVGLTYMELAMVALHMRLKDTVLKTKKKSTPISFIDL